ITIVPGFSCQLCEASAYCRFFLSLLLSPRSEEVRAYRFLCCFQREPFVSTIRICGDSEMKNQVNALAVLSVGEIEQVSGAGTFLGDAIINGVYAANSFLNSPLFSSIGNAASAIGLNRTHELVDLLAFQVPSVAAITVGKILGGTDNHNVPLHYNKESGEGLYS
ncbi:hypothetical protein ACLBYN_11760, partial [Pseudomonas aeruginosa]